MVSTPRNFKISRLSWNQADSTSCREPLRKQENFAQALVALRLAERERREFPADAARAPQNGDGNPLLVRALAEVAAHSRISSVKRRFSFMPAAPRMVRMERAVLPCLPITLPKSLGATLNSRTVTCSPSTTDGNFFRDVHQSFRDIFNQLFHHPASLTSMVTEGQAIGPALVTCNRYSFFRYT